MAAWALPVVGSLADGALPFGPSRDWLKVKELGQPCNAAGDCMGCPSSSYFATVGTKDCRANSLIFASHTDLSQIHSFPT
jgi:hypothetical protein